jgi:hypothetical protein
MNAWYPRSSSFPNKHPAVTCYNEILLQAIEHSLKDYITCCIDDEDGDLVEVTQTCLTKLRRRLEHRSQPARYPSSLSNQLGCPIDSDVMKAGAWTTEELCRPSALDKDDLFEGSVETAPVLDEGKVTLESFLTQSVRFKSTASGDVDVVGVYDDMRCQGEGGKGPTTAKVSEPIQTLVESSAGSFSVAIERCELLAKLLTCYY